MITIEEVNALPELDAVRADWGRLLAETDGANFFQTLEWLETYWRHFGAEQTLRCLIVNEGPHVMGIVPLVIRREVTRVGLLRFLGYPLDYWGSFYGPIGGRPTESLAAALHHIRRTRRAWDVLELRWVGGATACRCIEEALRQNAMRWCRTELDQTTWIELAEDWPAYLASRGSKWRNNFKRWRRRLEERAAVEYLRYRPRGESCHDADPRWDLYDDCIEIARKSWQGGSATGTTLSHPQVADFLRDVHHTAARMGALDLNLLYVGGRAAAFFYAYHYRGNVFGLRVGYDAHFSRDGVGNLLYLHAIEDSFARGDHLMDLGPGSLEAKRHLGTRVCPIYRYSYFPLMSLRPNLIRWKRLRDAAVAARAARSTESQIGTTGAALDSTA